MGMNNILPNSDLSKYVGKWVVICKNKVVAYNKDITKLKKDIDKCKTIPTVAKIPKKKILIF